MFLICLKALPAEALATFVQDYLFKDVCSEQTWKTEVVSSPGVKGQVCLLSTTIVIAPPSGEKIQTYFPL